MAGPTTAAGVLARDSGNRYFGHLWDTASGKGLAQRAHNVDAGNGVADSGVVLLDATGAPLLTAAATLADGMANPAVGRVGTHPLLYLSTAWVRARAATSDVDPGAVPAALVHGALARPAGPAFTRQYTADSVADGSNGQNSPAQMPMQYNGTTWDRQRGNTNQTIFASAARTATTSVSPIKSYNARIALVHFSVTAASGTGGLTFRWIWDSPQGVGVSFINAAPTTITAVGTYMYILSLDASAALAHVSTVAQVCNFPVPPTLGVWITHGDASSYTYSCGLSLMV